MKYRHIKKFKKEGPEEPVDDIRILDFRTSSSKYRLVRRRSKEYEICDGEGSIPSSREAASHSK